VNTLYKAHIGLAYLLRILGTENAAVMVMQAHITLIIPPPQKIAWKMEKLRKI